MRSQGHAWRRVWEHLHHFVGRAALALGIANVYIGFNTQRESAMPYIVYSAVLGALVLLWLGKEALDCVRPPPGGKTADQSAAGGADEEAGGGTGSQSPSVRRDPRCCRL